MAVRKTKAGLALKRWFKEDWKDQRTGKACGRKKGEKRAKYPSCRPTPGKCKDKGKGEKWGKTK